MMSLSDTTKIAILIFAVPLYAYFIVRWITSAIVRSYFEIKWEFGQLTKK
jgi:ACR3 family arsenite efflux pump ArsB